MRSTGWRSRRRCREAASRLGGRRRQAPWLRGAGVGRRDFLRRGGRSRNRRRRRASPGLQHRQRHEHRRGDTHAAEPGRCRQQAVLLQHAPLGAHVVEPGRCFGCEDLRLGVVDDERIGQRLIQTFDDLLHARGSQRRILLEHAHDQRDEPRGRRLRRLQRRDGLPQHAFHRRFGVVRRKTGQQLVGERAQPIDVVGRRRRKILQLLRARGERRALRVSLRRTGDAGRAEVREAHATLRIEQHVAGLQIPVHHAARMRMREDLRDADEHRHAAQVGLAAQPLEIAATGELHRQHGAFAFADRRAAAKDAGMIQPARHLRFVVEDGPGLDRLAQILAQELERHLLAVVLVGGGPDLAVPAAADVLEQHIAVADADSCGGRCHRGRVCHAAGGRLAAQNYSESDSCGDAARNGTKRSVASEKSWSPSFSRWRASEKRRRNSAA